jgi:hypothetical protein
MQEYLILVVYTDITSTYSLTPQSVFSHYLRVYKEKKNTHSAQNHFPARTILTNKHSSNYLLKKNLITYKHVPADQVRPQLATMCIFQKKKKKPPNYPQHLTSINKNYPPSIFTQKSLPKPFLNKIKHKNYETLIYTSASSAANYRLLSSTKAWLGVPTLLEHF